MALAGKHAFVTGGGRGIGRAVAAALARAGAAVTVIGRSEAPLREAVAAGEAAGCGVADVPDVVEVKREVTAAEAARGRSPSSSTMPARSNPAPLSRPIPRSSAPCGTCT